MKENIRKLYLSEDNLRSYNWSHIIYIYIYIVDDIDRVKLVSIFNIFLLLIHRYFLFSSPSPSEQIVHELNPSNDMWWEMSHISPKMRPNLSLSIALLSEFSSGEKERDVSPTKTINNVALWKQTNFQENACLG